MKAKPSRGEWRCRNVALATHMCDGAAATHMCDGDAGDAGAADANGYATTVAASPLRRKG
jgi:hypothetical protein